MGKGRGEAIVADIEERHASTEKGARGRVEKKHAPSKLERPTRGDVKPFHSAETRANTAEDLGLSRTPFYCEENVWHLCQHPLLQGRPKKAVFISNPLKVCPMWSQRAGRGRPIVWDYHVIVLAEAPFEVWDVDTTLGLPLPAAEYLAKSFHENVPKPYQPRFRLVPAEVYVDVFCSDRAHMRKRDGSFTRPAPVWPTITPKGQTPNLMRFVDMEQTFLGEVVDLPELKRRMTEKQSS